MLWHLILTRLLFLTLQPQRKNLNLI
ncbi:hypothetical protein [Escherichia phage BI-EHEC]|nr:hypothetical protein [Escherichia phage BI-EHEC]